MVKKSKKDNNAKSFQGYSDYDRLIYFRWKALIRSEEYLEFCEEADIEWLLEEKKENEEQIVSEGPDDETISLSLNEFTQFVEASGPPEGMDHDSVQKYKEILDAKYIIENMEAGIKTKAKERFGLIVWDLSELKPVDRQMDELKVTFKEYVPKVSKSKLSRIAEDSIVKDMTNTRWRVHDWLDGYKFFRIHPHMPIGLIMELLKKNLKGDARSPRKDFDVWEEGFKVWDIQQKTNNLYKTAKLMGWEGKKNRKDIEYTKEDLRGLVSKKINAIQKLINLAGKGRFKKIL